MLSPQSKPKRHWFRKLFYTVILLLWLVGLPLVYWQRQAINDWFRLQNYSPPTAISAIAAQDSMTDYGRKIFYVNEPQIAGKDVFNKQCTNMATEQTIVLGCYHSGQNGIYIYDVTDARLNGVEQVTAAHEMLHAAYERMSDSERAQVDQQLKDFYHNNLHDQRIIKTIDAYKNSEPKDLVNEMHSIFGTEVSNLPAPLEEHYKKYFADRQQVVAFADKYQSEFTSRQDAVASYDAQLESMKKQIDAMEGDVKAKQASISQQQKNLVALRNGGEVDAYNAGVPGYNDAVNQYNAEVQQLKNLISQYNQIVATRNSVALEENELAKDINSQAQTINN